MLENKPKLTKEDNSDIDFAITCLFYQAITLNEFKEWLYNIIKDNILCYSNFIHKIRVDNKKINPEYLFCFLKMMHNIRLTEAMQSQTNGIRNLIMNSYLNQNIVIPIFENGKIDIQKQTEIANRITAIREKAKKLQLEAFDTLETAKRNIEEMILGD